MDNASVPHVHIVTRIRVRTAGSWISMHLSKILLRLQTRIKDTSMAYQDHKLDATDYYVELLKLVNSLKKEMCVYVVFEKPKKV